MIRLNRIPTLAVIALLAIAAGGALPFSPALLAAPASVQTEEEKNPSEPTTELKLTHVTPRPDAGSTPKSTGRSGPRPAPTRPLYALSLPFSPAVALNNGLSSHYRC